MDTSRFKPGFRFSLLDILILIIGFFATFILSIQLWWIGMVIGIVVSHFFLFCNVFRISRSPELIWAAVFTVLAGTTILTGFPGWTITVALSITLSSFLIWRESKKPGYHGICWKTLNPALPEWWKESQGINKSEQGSAPNPLHAE